MKSLTPVELYTLYLMAYIMRLNRRGYVTVKELAKAMNRAESRVRAILNSLKEKGFVIDIGDKKSNSNNVDSLSIKIDRRIAERFRVRGGGVEKLWSIVGYNILDDSELERFFRDLGKELEMQLGVSIKDIINSLKL